MGREVGQQVGRKKSMQQLTRLKAAGLVQEGRRRRLVQGCMGTHVQQSAAAIPWEWGPGSIGGEWGPVRRCSPTNACRNFRTPLPRTFLPRNSLGGGKIARQTVGTYRNPVLGLGLATKCLPYLSHPSSPKVSSKKLAGGKVPEHSYDKLLAHA